MEFRNLQPTGNVSPTTAHCVQQQRMSRFVRINAVKQEQHGHLVTPWWSQFVPSYLGLVPNSHYLPHIVNQTHQMEPVCAVNTDPVITTLVHLHTFVSVLTVPLSGCAWRIPSAVWKAWKEFGKSTSGSDSSTSWSKDMMASIIPFWVCVQPFQSECCRKEESRESSSVILFRNTKALLRGSDLIGSVQISEYRQNMF